MSTELIPLVATAAAALGAATLLAPWWHPPARRPGHDATATAATRPAGSATLVVERRVLALGALAVSAATVVAVVSPALAAIGVVAAVTIGRHQRRRHVEQRRRRRTDALPELVDALVALVHAGLTPPLAWRELRASCPPVLVEPVRAAAHRMDRGETFADALRAFGAEIGPGAHALVDTLVTAERYGLPLGPVLQRLSTDAAAQRRRTVEATARQLPVRLSFPLVLCTLPSFVLLAVAPVLVTALSSLPRP